ncbi:MAG: Ig-like domain-containing protein [Anaerovoracaceae bacterium]|nr:Ig-like domain-containing protein [Anaerovoracaceae bacterium]
MTICLCMIFGMMPATAQAEAGESADVSGPTVEAYKIGETSFNVKGVDKNRKYWTTFLDRGYDTAVSVDGRKTRNRPGRLIASGLSLDVTLDRESNNYIKVQYTLSNTGSKVHKVKVGSHADVMIDNNDRAPVCATEDYGKTLSMTGSPRNNYAFKLIAPTCDTLWYGYYTKCFNECFTDMKNRGPKNVYSKDSGISYSWTATVEPGQTWSRYVLIGTGSAEQMNVGTPTIPQPEEIVPDPEITLNTSELYLTEGDSLPADWNSYIASSKGTVTVTGKPASTNTPGTYTVTYTATNKKGTKKEASLTVHILQKPAELSQASAINVTNTNNFTLTATMLQTGGVNWTETGFVYGALQNPTMTLNDGSVKTASAVNMKNGSIKAVATGLTEGITCYARAYAKASDGTIIYGPQSAGFGLNAPNYGTFQVTNSGSNTFTISRTGGTDGEQTVYYRTVNGSAVGGTHFTHKADSVTFAKGVRSKNVTVTEKTANTAYYTNDITAHTNADRTYQLEIYRVEGGATIDGNKAKATRTMTKSSSYTISRNVYKEQARSVTITDNNKWVADHSGTGNWKIYFKNDRKKNTDQLNFNVQRSLDASDLSIAYLKKTAKNLLYRADFTYREDEDGYQLVWMGPEAPGYGPLEIDSKKCIGLNTSLGCAYFTATWETNNNKTAAMSLPAMSGSEIKAVNDFINRYIAEINGKKYVEFGIDDTVHVWFSSAGADKDIWHMESYTDYIKVYDVNEPQLIAIAPMAGGKYLQGDSVTVSLIFDEIVDSTNSSLSSSSTITTNWGTFKYAGGVDTNVLYFTGTVPTNAGSPIKLSKLDCASQIKDMSDDTGKVSGFITEKSASVTVGTVAAPTVSIGTITNASGILTGKITATKAKKLEYVWTDSKTVPASGWRMLSNTTSATVTTRQTSGTWYLHARATNSDGRTATAYKSVTIPATGSNTYAAPDLTVNANNSSWAKTRNITVTRSPANATVKVKTPEGDSETVTGSSYTAMTNGVYTFTLTYNGEIVTRQAVVSKLDNTAPNIEINDLKNTAHADQVALTFSVTDGGSGVGNVTAKWNNSGAALTKNGDGTYTTTCPNTTGSWKLTVTAADGVGNSSNKVSATYTVNLDKPVLAVNKTGSTSQGVSYSYSVNANGNEDVTVYIPDGTQTDKLKGTFTLKETGPHIIAVTDKAGHFVSQEITVTETVDGVAPEVRLYADDSVASDELTVEVMVYEERGMPTVKQDSSAVTVTADTEEAGNYIGSFTVAKGGEYTVTATDAAGNADNGSITVYALINGDNTTLKLPETDGTYGALPTPDERTGYTFDGWYTVETGGTKADSSMEVTAYTLYARWIPLTYEVTLIGDRDSGKNLTSYTFGKGAALPDDWTKQCAKFDGWYTVATGGSKIDKIGADESGNKTYYARWTPLHTWKDATCTVPKTCSVCNTTEGSALGHKYETAWSKDADKHWHKCSACGDKTNEETHSWDKGTVTIQPGCTTAGTKTFGCICGATKTENIDAAGHTAGAAVRENEVAATCTTDGSYDEVVYCADCRKELSREKKTVDALGHDCVHHNAKAATCTEKGWEAYDTCSRCDYTTYKETPAKGHSKGDAKKEKEVAATCTSAGRYDEVIYCTVCKAEISRESKTTPAAGHSFGAWTVVKEATCTAEGHETRVCSVCSAKEDKDIGKLSHEESDWITDENNHWKICTVCNAVIEDETAHTFGNWVIDENATEATEGSRHRECIICGHINRETIPELGHTHSFDREVTEDKYLKSEATCTMPAVYYKSCNCGEKGTETFEYGTVNPDNHTGGTEIRNASEANHVLQTKGYTGDTYCRGCNTKLSSGTEILPGNHIPESVWKMNENNHWKECSVFGCGIIIENTSGAHVYGGDGDADCNVCGYNRDIAPAHTHNWAAEWSHDTDYHWHECLNSGCDVTENSFKNGYAPHIGAAAVRENETAATCTTAGRYDEVIYCTVCKAEISRRKNITKALDHEWGNWVVTKQATSSEDGEEQRVCKRSNCSHVETKIIPALTHTHQYSEVVKDEYIKTVATCTEPAVYYTSCECGKRGADTFTSGDVLGHDFTIMQHDENQHWKKCSRCDVTDTKSNHVYDNEQDNICNVCGYNRDIAPAHTHNWADTWSHNTAYHWHECLNSGCDVTENSLKDGYAEHVPGDPATETKPQICTECGYIIQVAQGHTHTLIKVDGTPATCTEEGVKDYWKCSECGKLFENEQGTAEITDTGIPAKGHSYSSVWSSDTACHWHQCIACIAETDKAAHIWGTGVITTPPTTTEEGIKTYTCEVCGTAKTESVPKRHSGGGVTPPKKDTITVDVTGDKTSVKITAEISGDTASIAEIGRNDIDKAGTGADITIDLTVLPNEIAEVTVTKNSLENIYDSETDNVSIKLTETTVNMDRATLKNIIEQMNGSDLKLVVDKHQDALESMNKAQKDTLKGMKNPKLIDAYFISGGIRITDFKGGSVEIKVPYSDKKRVRAWYIDDNGKKEKVPVKYDGKTAVLTISHFSHYVIEEDSSNNVKPAHVKKTSDKVIYVRSIKYSKKTGTKITFNKVSGADGYYVYGNRCNTDKVYKFKKLATLKGNDNTVFVHKKTAKNTFYKYYIKAYRLVDGRRVTVSRSEEIHFVTDVKGYKYGNPTKVALSSKKCTLNKGKTFNLKNRVKVYSSKKVLLHTDKVRYVSSDSRVAKVNSRGRITAEKAGRCNIYAIAQNGRAAKITVTVK